MEENMSRVIPFACILTVSTHACASGRHAFELFLYPCREYR